MAMKKLFTVLVLSLAAIVSMAQNYKVLERSEKKTPSWVGRSGDGFICVSATADDMEAARAQCMRSIKIDIIEAIAVNVVSESKSYMENKQTDDVSSFVNDFMSSSTTKAAQLPFLTGISPSKIADTYWEKLQDKSTRKITYMVAVQYPLTDDELNDYREQFLKLDREMEQLTLDLEKGVRNVSSLEELDNGLAKIQECIEYFFDARRKKWAESVAEQYRMIPSRLSLHGKEGRDDSYTVWLELDGRKITPAGNPKLTSNCAGDLKFTRNGQDYVITYDTSDCLSDEQNTIEVSFRIKGKTIREKFVIE